MKKILCLFLAVLTILSNSFCVFAANTTVNSTTNITTENPGEESQTTAGVVTGGFEQAVTAAPITITSIKTDLASPQRAETKIRWTCIASGGTSLQYYYKIYKGTTVVTQSSAYSTNNYFDWTPAEEGTNYRALVYVKEAGSANSTSITMLSDYYIIDNNIIIKQNISFDEWAIDDQNGYIYTVSMGSNNSLLLEFIRLSDLEIEKSIVIGFYPPCDIDTADGKVYVALTDATVVVVDVAEKAVEKILSPREKPYRIAVDGDKLFYTQENEWSGLYVYDLATNSETDITKSLAMDDYELDLAIDRKNHVLYAGESSLSGCSIRAFSTTDYSLLSQSTYPDDGYGFPAPERSVVYDGGSVYYAGYSLDASNLEVVNGYYNETIVYAKDNYVFSKNSIYDRDKYLKVKDLPFAESKILMDAAGNIYLYDIPFCKLYKQHMYYKLDSTMRHTNSLNNLILDEQLTSWVSNEDNSYIYAVSQSGNKLLFIRTSDLTVEKELYVGSIPSDIELANGYLYIPLSGSTKVVVVDPSTEKVSKSILVKVCPYRIAIDGNKLFYTTRQWDGLYVYELSNGSGNDITRYGGYSEPDLAVDRINHVLYVGESGSSGSNIYSFSSIDYSQISKSIYDDGYGFPYPARDVIYDNESIYYAGRKFEANDLASILGTYNEHIIYAKDMYVFSKNHVFDRDSYQPVVTFDKSADLAAMLNDGSYLLYNDQASSISKNAPLPLPVKIVSLTADKASPQLTNTTIRWTCNISGGTKPVYYFRVYKGSTLVKNSPAYSTTNYLDWTPTAAGTDYRILVNVKEDGSANSSSVTLYSSYYTIAAPAPIAIQSVVPDKTSPQLTGTTIRWTCNITGGGRPVYYFRVYKGSTLVKNSSAYSATNYFDWTPAEAGMDYRVLVNVKEDGSANSTSVARYSSYFTVTAAPAPIVITSLVPDKASPQPTGAKIRWTCNITGGAKPVYYFKIFKGSTVVSSSTTYTTTNYFDWTPTAAGTDYRALVYVREPGSASSAIVTKYSSYFTVTAPPTPIVITSLTPNKTSPQPTGATIRWTCNITGGVKPVYYFKILKGSTVVSSSTAYTATNYFDWTPTEAGTDYRALVYVREPGSASSTIVTRYSSYYTVTVPPTPIVIKSVAPDKTSPQQTNTAIRWTCNITGGVKPVYYFRVYKGSTLVKNSPAYSTTNYFDWAPTEAGTDYRILVNVKEDGTANSTSVAMYSAYYTVTAPAPKVIETPVPEVTDPGLGSINIIDIPLVK